MGVVELVALPVPEPEPVAADLVPADREDGAVGDREQGLADLAEDVVAVMPAARDVAAGGAEGVRVRRGAVDREDIAAGRQSRVHRRRQPEAGRVPATRPRGFQGAVRLVVPARDEARRRAGGRLRLRCRWRGLGGRFCIAELDLAPGRQAAVVGVQMHDQGDDRALVPLCSLGRGRVGRLHERQRIAPVRERDAEIRRRRHRLAQHDEVRQGRAREVSAGVDGAG